MSTPYDKAIEVTGWDPSVVSYLHDEFVEDDGDDFLEYLGDQVATAAFVIAASNGLGISTCLEAYAHGFESVINEDFDVDAAIDNILYEDEELDCTEI
jgi:hypothetical protein